MLDIRVANGKIFVKKCGLTFSGNPLKISCDSFLSVKLYLCSSCKSECFDLTLDVYYDTFLSVPYIVIDNYYKVPIFEAYLYKNLYIKVISED